jgi:hypothetical protein
MWYYWKSLFEKIEHWKKLFWTLYNFIGDKEYRLENPIHAKIRVAPFTYKEYRIEKISAKKGRADEYIKFNLINDYNGEINAINVYPAFELKSDSKIINEPVIFEMLVKQLKDDGIIKEKSVLVADTIVV